MKEIKIRLGVFETNSSSSHSISFNPWQPGKSGNNFLPDTDGKIHIHGEGFGWGWFKYNDAITKANYYLEEFKDDEDRLEVLKEVIEDFTGYPVVIEKDDDGYIDHQSQGTLTISKSREEVKDFIFNPDVWLYIGDDNSDEPHGFRNDEISGIGGSNTHKVTIRVNDTDTEFLLPDFPSESNLNNFANELTVNGDCYYLKEFNLEKGELTYECEWKNDLITAKIIKITDGSGKDI